MTITDTKKPRNRQGENLQNANTPSPRSHHEYAETPIDVHARRVRGLTLDEDAIDRLLHLHSSFTQLADDLDKGPAGTMDASTAAGAIRDLCQELGDTFNEAGTRSEHECGGLWHLPPVFEIDSALWAMRERVLPRWFPGGTFDEGGKFEAYTKGELIVVSRNGTWLYSSETWKIARQGFGLCLLKSLVDSEPLDATVARLAAHPNIAARLARGAAS